MDDVTREYLYAINKIADPTQVRLLDEVVWVELMKAVIMSPKSHGDKTIDEVADAGLEEFKTRFRK